MKPPPDPRKLPRTRATTSRKGKLSDDDLWNAYSNKITPLSQEQRNLNLKSQSSASVPVRPPSTDTKSTGKAKALPRGKPPAPLQRPPVVDFEHGRADGLDRSSQKKMRRGKIEIEARLDLHGMTQTQAHRSLLGFMERSHAGGKRTVLVITGKGLTRHGDIGVLRQAVPRWLNEPPLRAWIRGFDYAAPADGGEGALYILLRRKR